MSDASGNFATDPGGIDSIYDLIGKSRMSADALGTSSARTSSQSRSKKMGLQTVPRRRRICFITVEFHGFFKNGGIGTANTALALALAAHGFEVTVALANMDPSSLRTKGSDFSGLRTSYAARGIILDCVPPHPFIAGAFDDPRTASYSVYSYLYLRDRAAG